MYLKKLEIHGFKSFADKTELFFEPGITVVVGPNGCGKTNVADSIRWVLGEQSAKGLRASELLDFIFNGTDVRKPSSLAEVVLTLSNEDKTIPLEFNEISIARRIYRSGESEYLINGVLARLKDVRELFMGTGLGISSYSILEQGKIDQILNSKPVDRRNIFEEAAGITKFRARKTEALRKLESTEQNLIRISDVVLDLKRQISSREKQARQAEKHREYREQFNKRQIQIQLANLKLIEKQLSELREKIKHSREKVGKVSSEIHALEDGEKKIRLELETKENEISKVKEQLYKIESEMEINRGKSEGIKQHQLLLTDQYKHNEEETVKSKLRINQLKVWISERLTFFQTQEDRRSEKLLKQGERESKLTELEKEFILKNEILENKNTTALNILMHSAQLTSELESARTYKKNLEVQLSDLKNSSLALHQEHTHLKEKLILIQQESAQFMDQRKKIQEEITDLQFQQASAGEQVEKISSLIQQFQTELSALRSRHQILEELQNKFTGYDSGVKCILQSKKTEPLIWQDTLGIVADLITVDASCENIVESILGSQLQALVVKNQEQALGISNKLKLDVQGKVGILILSDLKQLTFSEIPHELQKHASYRGALIDFLKYDSEIKPIVQFLFSKVILVRELAEAIELNTRYPDFFFLAEDGSWVGPLGVWKTGSALKEVSLLGRHREILEIDQKIKSIEERLDQEEIQLKEARTLLATMMASRTQFEGQKEKILENISQLERSDFQTHELLEQVEKRQASQMQQQDDAVKNLEATDQKIHQLSAILSQNEQTHHLTQDEITAARKEIQALQSSKEEWIKQVLQIRMELETLEADAMRAKKEAEQYQQELDQMLILSDQKTEENVHINQRMEHLVMTLSESEHRIQQLTENYSSLDAQLQKIRVERDQFVLSVQDAMQQLNGFRSEAGENQKILHELELQEIAMNVGMRNIEEKLSLEYKVDLSNLPVGLDEKFSIKDAEKECAELQLKIEKLGLINMVAMEEYNDLTQRCKFLEEQQQDLLKAKDDLKKVINKINLTSKELFQSTFQTVQENFKDIFQRLFEGGRAELLLEEENVLESGIEIVVRPPGKRLQSVSLLSGGEKALTAIALLFALFMVKPSPFCLMDEIDAPLDEVNITRFIQLLKEFSKKTQFIVISHNKTTMETGDVIYGVTMQESGVSKVVSAKFREHTEESTLVSQ